MPPEMPPERQPGPGDLGPPRRRPRFTMGRSVLALLLREMATTYGRSPGGYLWAILEPVAGILLLTLVFAAAGLRSPALGTSFPIFFATGLLPFLMAIHVIGTMAQAINASKPLLAYPRVSFLDALAARFLLAALTDLLVFHIVIVSILVVWDTRTEPDLLRLLLALSMTWAVAIGLGLVNCVLFSMIPVWQRVWSIVSRPLFLISGVFFLYENVPEPYAGWIWYNPLIHVTGVMRAAFYPGYEAEWASAAYVFGLAAVSTCLGLLFLRRYHRDILER